MELVFLNFW